MLAASISTFGSPSRSPPGAGLVGRTNRSAARIASKLRASSPKPDDYVIVGDSLGGGDYAIGVRENDSRWRDALNFTLQDIWKDGTWDKIYDKWIGPGTKLNLKKDEIGFKMELWD